MKRSDFIEEINNFYSLRQFCYDFNLEVMNDVFDFSEAYDFVEENVVELASQFSWESLRDTINEIYYTLNIGCYYKMDDWMSFQEISEEDIKDSVLFEMDALDLWESEEDEDCDSNDSDENLEEDCSFNTDAFNNMIFDSYHVFSESNRVDNSDAQDNNECNESDEVVITPQSTLDNEIVFKNEFDILF